MITKFGWHDWFIDIAFCHVNFYQMERLLGLCLTL